MMGIFEAFDLAHREFDRALRGVADDQWTLPTPCAEWNVHDVANHVVGANYYFIALTQGASKEEALAVLAHDFLQPDPVSAFGVQRPKLSGTFCAPGALERIGHHVVGDMTGAQLLRGSVSETAVHTWDIILATSIEPQLDPQLAEVALAIFEQLAPIFQVNGFTAPSVDISPDASVQARMAAIAGRGPYSDTRRTRRPCLRFGAGDRSVRRWRHA